VALDNDRQTRAALDLISSNYFGRYEPVIFAPIHDALIAYGNRYMYLADFKSYLEADQQLCELYGDSDGWARKTILNVASSEVFQRTMS
jgi:starch phosphorylase